MSDEGVKEGAEGVSPEAAKVQPSAPPAKEGGKNFVLYDDKIEIHYDKPLPVFDIDRNRAYRAFAKDKFRTPLVAIICENHYVVRLSALPVYKAIINPNLAQLIENGRVFWPPARQERYVLIYLDNFGKPLYTEGNRVALGWRQEDVVTSVLKPMVNILLDFRDKDFVHGAIRPANIFDGGGTDKNRKVILGDCLSTPASYAQPILYETIHRSMADPQARGRGTHQDDLYAFGVTLAVIMRQHDPLHGLSPKETVQQKIQYGSYSAVTGKDRFKGEILELLRGLLNDDASQRWGLDEVLGWLDGRRLSPKQALTAKKAQRSISFNGEKYLLPHLLAMDLESSPIETKKIIEDESLMQWLIRSLDDEEAAARLEKSISATKQNGTGPGYEDRLVTNTSIALDVSSPIRFKGLHLMGDGLGVAMVEAVALKQNLTPYAEVFNANIVGNWLAVQTNSSLDISGLHNKFELCRRYMRSNKLGEGMERCIYLLAPEAHCLSDIYKDYLIIEADDLLRALEDLCQKKRAPSIFLDRHVAAFLFQRDPKLIEPYAFDLNTNERHRVVLATLKCLANIQRRYEVPDVAGVAKSLASQMQSVYRRYHDRTIREKLQKSIEEFAELGDLQKMASLLDNPDVVNKDYAAFRKAMLEYDTIEKERLELEGSLGDKATFGIETGKEWAVIASCALSALIIIGTVFMFFSHKPVF